MRSIKMFSYLITLFFGPSFKSIKNLKEGQKILVHTVTKENTTTSSHYITVDATVDDEKVVRKFKFDTDLTEGDLGCATLEVGKMYQKVLNNLFLNDSYGVLVPTN